ncbi:YchJ family protein [Pedobacter sp.]
MTSNSICPCSSGKHYADCCQAYHQFIIFPQTAEQLMRSRYGAYALHLVDYLWETTHPTKRNLYDKAAMEQWAKANHWTGLEIVYADKKVVEFKAHYQKGLTQFVHHERSTFKKEDGRWYYFSGDYFN